MRKQVELLKHHAHVPSQLVEPDIGVRADGEAMAGDRDPASFERLETVEAAKQRALAAPRRTDEHRHAPVDTTEAHRVEHGQARAVLRQ